MKRHDKHFVYILKDNRGRFYTGYTQNLGKRILAHEKGNGAKYLIGRGPFELVFHKEFKYYKNALNAEQKFKKYTQKRKEELINIHAKQFQST